MSKPNDAELAKISATGPGLASGKTGEKCSFRIEGIAGAKQAENLTFTIQGPSKPDVNIGDYQVDGSCQVDYTPLHPGQYIIKIRWRGKQISGSPFKVDVAGEAVDISGMIAQVSAFQLQ